MASKLQGALWYWITAPQPISCSELKIAAATFTQTLPSGGKLQRGFEESRLFMKQNYTIFSTYAKILPPNRI
jgi:hypothetical protein